MPKPPPRPLCLPELVANPQTRLNFIQANPPKHGPLSSRPSSFYDCASNSSVPPSPTSTNDANSHRTSAATSTSLMSPGLTASTRTSLSVHNLPWNGDASKRSSGISGLLSRASNGEGKGWNLGNLTKRDVEDKKPRASWSSAFSGTKSWFGHPAAAESREDSALMPNTSDQREIKLSPSMIAAGATSPSHHSRPMSSPYPMGSPRTPRVGTGLQYYSERNPAPANIRVQIPGPIDDQTLDQPPPAHLTNAEASMAISVNAKESSPVPGVSVLASPDVIESSPPTRDSNVPDIRVSFGEDS
ncbi:hypothetical protein BU17DRAFT_84087 [Hysterangium stoloniferum]|nr:hypothetical protein BU17DRAFT_84087 [Hysterangium stoloniferum]